MPTDVYDEARAWLWDVFDDAPATLTDQEAHDAVERHYWGGWSRFVTDCAPLTA